MDRLKRVVLVLSVIVLTACAHQIYSGGGGGSPVTWSAHVPESRGPLPVLRLTPQPASAELIDQILAGAPGAKLQPLSDVPILRENKIDVPRDIAGVFENNHVKAWVDPRNGNMSIYPTLSNLTPLPGNDTRRSAGIAADLYKSGRFVAIDDTTIEALPPVTLNGSTLVRRGGETHVEKPNAPYLVYVPARRLVSGLPVFGPGSRALIIVGNDGRIEGLTRRWKVARITDRSEPLLSSHDVMLRIEKELRSAAKNASIEVRSVELGYYDGDRDMLQPVYRYTAHIRYDRKGKSDDDFVIGFVPYGKELERIPALTDLPQGRPSDPRERPPAKTALTGLSTLDPAVGRYVVRNDYVGWVNSANAFWGGLQSGWGASLFADSQYYWAEARLFTNEKDTFINNMQLGLVEVHGNWWFFTTDQACCDGVNISDIPSPGYGGSANGTLANWVIHSCEVIPSPDDVATWPDQWWTVFGGIHNIVGYRTIMYIDDAVAGPYATDLSNGAPVVSSWLNEVMASSAYANGDSEEMHGRVKPLGRPATLSACGHDGDWVYSMDTLPPADCLTIWWFPD